MSRQMLGQVSGQWPHSSGNRRHKRRCKCQDNLHYKCRVKCHHKCQDKCQGKCQCTRQDKCQDNLHRTCPAKCLQKCRDKCPGKCQDTCQDEGHKDKFHYKCRIECQHTSGRKNAGLSIRTSFHYNFHYKCRVKCQNQASAPSVSANC